MDGRKLTGNGRLGFEHHRISGGKAGSLTELVDPANRLSRARRRSSGSPQKSGKGKKVANGRAVSEHIFGLNLQSLEHEST
jgi:hypothetical protein